MLLKFLEMVLPVRHGERRLTFTLFFHSLFAVGAFLTGRTVRDALFLAHGERSQLAWMYVLSAIFVTLSGLAYTRLAAHVRRDLMALISASFFGAIFVLLWQLERLQMSGIYTVIYVVVEVMGALILVQFWTLANELFNAREAKRLYGFIGAGGTFANILLGLISARVATAFGASSLLLMCALLLLITGGASFAGGRLGRQRLFARAAAGKPSPAKRSGGASRVRNDNHLRTVAVLSAVTFFTTTLIDFQFKVVAADKLGGDELAAYFGYFNAVVGALALGLQLFGTSRLLNRVGVIGALAVLPISLAMGDLALLLFPALWAASMAKGADTLFRYSVNDATTQILYLPVPAQVRVSAKAFIDGVIKPLAIGLAGIALAAYRLWTNGNPYTLAWFSLALALIWVGVVMGMRTKYIKSLQENVKQRRLDLESARHQVIDGSTNRVLERALGSEDEQEVLNALALLPHLEKIELDQRVEALLEHASSEVRVKALEYYAHRQTMRFANSVFRCFEDAVPAVRAAAIDAFCAMGRDKAVRSVKPFLTDAHPRIRSAAITGMIRFGGLDGVLVAAEALKALIDNADPVMRQHAAKVLGAIGVRNFYQPIIQLMNDTDVRVRREAIVAAGTLKSQEFVIPLIYRTQSRDTQADAIQALTAYGATIVPTLTKVLSNHLEDAQVRQASARILGKLGTAEAIGVIIRHLDTADEDLRGVMYRAVARAVKGRPQLLENVGPVKRAANRELERAWRALHQLEALKLDIFPGAHTPGDAKSSARALLASALVEKVKQVEGRIFLLLAILYPHADMEHISAGIQDASAADSSRRRGNAVELLDNLLERGIKERFLPLVEDMPRAAQLKQVAVLYPSPASSAEALLRDMTRDETPWVRACSTWCLAETGKDFTARDEALAQAANDGHPVVREIGLLTLSRRAPTRAAALLKSRLADDSPSVRRQAEVLLGLNSPMG